MSRILIRRGNKVDLPALNVGEPGFATDTKEIFVGASGGNVQAVTKLSGGAKVQSGFTTLTVVTPGTPVSVPVVFPQAFATVPVLAFSILVNTGSSGYVNATYSNLTATGFTLFLSSYIAQGATIQWIAIGG